MNVIYALLDQRTRECRYIGKTRVGLRERLRRHIKDARRSPGARKCTSWVFSLLSTGISPEIVQIEECGEDWQEPERFWIAYMRYVGANLTNMREGGGGENRSQPSDVVRKKISDASKAQFSRPGAREAASRYARDAWLDPHFAEARRASLREISARPDYRMKQSAAKKSLWSDPDYARKMSDAQRAADHSTGAKNMWQRPEYREAQRLARIKRYGSTSVKGAA